MDKIDRAIIRVLLRYLDNYLSTNQIAIKAEVAPLTARRRLTILKEQGYVNFQIGKIRDYERGTSKEIIPKKPSEEMLYFMADVNKSTKPQKKRRVKSPSKISWTLRYNKKKKDKNE